MSIFQVILLHKNNIANTFSGIWPNYIDWWSDTWINKPLFLYMSAAFHLKFTLSFMFMRPKNQSCMLYSFGSRQGSVKCEVTLLKCLCSTVKAKLAGFS